MQTPVQHPVGISSSPKLLLTLAILGAYGAIEGVCRLVRVVPVWWKRLKGWWRSKTRDEEFYFVSRETGVFMDPDAKRFHYVRQEKVRAIKHVERIPISYRWSGTGTITPRVIPDCHILEDSPRGVGQISTTKRLILHPPLEKSKEAEYYFILDCEIGDRAPEPYVSSATSHRVDKLIIRAVFPYNQIPRRVFYIERDADGFERVKEELKLPDILTGEFRKQVLYAEPHIRYILQWES